MDLAHIAEVTEIHFETNDLVHVAVQCLKDIAKGEELTSTVAAVPGATTATCHDNQKSSSDLSGSPASDTKGGSDPTIEESADKVDSRETTTDQCATAQGTSQSSPTAAVPLGATAPVGESTKTEADPVKDSSHNWIARLVNEGHSVLWPWGMTPTTGPTLLTGVKIGEAELLIDNLMEWERKLESADPEKHKQFLQDAQLTARANPLEAAAWENGYVPEAEGLPSDQLELRIQGSMPPLAYMVSRPRQPVDAGEELLRRFDAGIRPYWLRDWQSGFGGYTKVYEYQVNGVTKRKFSVAHVVRPRTKSSKLVCALPCCPKYLIRSHGKELPVSSIHLGGSSWTSKRIVIGRCHLL